MYNMDIKSLILYKLLIDVYKQTHLTNLKRAKWLHGEEFACPQLKVETKTVQESPDQNHLTGSQPEDGDAEGAQCSHKLLHHVLVLSTQVIIHIPVD